MSFAEIFWPAFWAMIASGVVFELFHLGVGLFMNWRAMKHALKMREQIAKKMGIEPEQLDVMADTYGAGGDFPMGGTGFPPANMFPPTVSGNVEGREGHGPGQYL